MVLLTSPHKGAFKKEVINHKQNNNIPWTRFSRVKIIWKFLVPGNSKEVTSCGWREGSTPLSTKEAVIFKRCIKTKQNKTVGLQCEHHEEISEKKENIFQYNPKLDVCLCAQSSPNHCNPIQCTKRGSFLHGIFPGKKICVGNHFLFHTLDVYR